MSKHSTNVGEYKEMYLINKFQKDIMENSLVNMSSEKLKSKENLPTLNMISQTTQTNTPEDLNESKGLPLESIKNVVSHTNSVTNVPTETNNNIQEKILKNDKLNDEVKDTKNSKKPKKVDKKKTKIHSIAKTPIKRMKTRNMSQNLTNHIYQNIAKKNTKKFTEKNTMIHGDSFFNGWKV